MGNEVTMGEALVVTVVSMLVVFVVLILISLTITFLKSFGAEKKEVKKNPPENTPKQECFPGIIQEAEESSEDESVSFLRYWGDTRK